MQQVVKCSNCDKELVQIDKERATKNVAVKCKVECCYCGDFSFVFDFLPGSGVSGIVKLEEIDEVFHSGYITDVNPKGGVEFKYPHIENLTSFIGMDRDKKDKNLWVFKTVKG